MTVADGTLIFYTPTARVSGATLAFTVDNVTKDGAVYTTALNVEEPSGTVAP